MASPRRVFRIYHRLHQDAETVRDFLAAKGDAIPGTVLRLIAKDRGHLLIRWGEELGELCGVLDGSHQDSYLMEATQCWYWLSLYAVTGGAAWDDLAFAAALRAAPTCGISSIPELRAAARRLVDLGPAQARPAKLALLWAVGDHLYRAQTPPEKQWSIAQLMEAEIQDMKKRPYLEPFLREIGEEDDEAGQGGAGRRGE